MSKSSPAPRRDSPAAGTGRVRLFRNFYTRNGSRHYVRGWRIKVQIAGRRTTHALRSDDRAAAAAEAARLVRRLRGKQRGSAPDPEPGRVRLVRRPHLPPGTDPAQWSACLPSGGRPEYYPLGTSNAEDAARRARQLHRDLRRHGLSGIRSRHPREVTVALHWSVHPVLWTYSTLHTRPGVPPSAIPEVPGGWRVGVVEPEAGLACAIREALAASDPGATVALWQGPLDAIAALQRDPADLILVHQSLDGLSGAELIARLRVIRPQTVFVEYSVCCDSDELFRSTPGGAPLYVLRRTPWHRMLEALDGRPRPGSGTPGRWTRHVQEYFQKQVGALETAGHLPPLPSLTPRESEILGWMSRGFLDKEIARELRISVWTVHGHAKRIYEKLGVHSRTEAVVRYLQK